MGDDEVGEIGNLAPAMPGLQALERVHADDQAEGCLRQLGTQFGKRRDRVGRAGASHLAVVHDDALQGVTMVIRGADLAFATPLHRVLQALLELPTPAYRHHRLVTDASGRRFAKRDGAATLRALRAAGATPAEVRARVGLA